MPYVQVGRDYTDGQPVDVVRLGDHVLASGAVETANDMNLGNRDSRDLLFGFAGNDTISSGPLEDWLYGGEGDDILNGGAADDFLDGGADDDIIVGGQGNDRVSYQAAIMAATLMFSGSGTARRADVSNTGQGNDSLSDVELILLTPLDDKIVISGRLPDHGVEIRSGGGQGTSDTFDFKQAGIGLKVTVAASGDTTVQERGGSPGVVTLLGFKPYIDGTARDDEITTGLLNGEVRGGLGNDTVTGGSETQTLHGEDGNDVLEGGSGEDYLYGGEHNDVLRGGDGDSVDHLYGGGGDDTLHGGGGADIIDGGPGADRIVARDAGDQVTDVEGDNHLISYWASNILVGGIGNDIIDYTNAVFEEGDTLAQLSYSGGNDYFVGRPPALAEDYDTFYYNQWNVEVTFNPAIPASGYSFIIDPTRFDPDGSGGGYYYGDIVMLVPGGGSVFFGNAYASKTVSGSTVTWGFGLPVTIGAAPGLGGLTILDGQVSIASVNNYRREWNSGDDELEGREGSEDLDGGGGNDLVNGGRGRDRLKGGGGNDVLRGNGGNPSYLGSRARDEDPASENDTLQGGLGDDRLEGEDGDDLLEGGAGSDTLNGGGGADTFLLSLGSDSAAGAPDVLQDFTSGQDVIDVSGLQLAGAAYVVVQQSPNGSVVQIDADANGAFETIVLLTTSITAADIVGSGVGVITIGDGSAQPLKGTALSDALAGGGGNDTVTGAAGNDSLYGQDGDDLLYGQDGGDFGYGGGGADVLLGGAGADSLLGEDGADQVYGEAGADLLYGGEGADQLWGGAEGDTLLGQNGDDSVNGEDGNDTLFGDSSDTAGADTLSGGLGNDTLYGGALGDQLLGGEGADTLVGESGDDVLTGGAGADLLVGGAGADRFRFTAASESTNAGFDQITDFVAGVDLIDLFAIDADSGLSEDQAFVFVTGALTAGKARLIWDAANNRTVFEGDVNGDGVPDVVFTINGQVGAGDGFVL